MKLHGLISFILSMLSVGLLFLACGNSEGDSAGTASEVVTTASISGTLVHGSELQTRSTQVLLYQEGASTAALGKSVETDSLIADLTTQTGLFQFTDLPAGTYRIDVKQDSIIVGSQGGIELSNGQALQITITINIIIQQNIQIQTINNVYIQNIFLMDGVAQLGTDGTYTFKFPASASNIPVTIAIRNGNALDTINAQLIALDDSSYVLQIPENSEISLVPISSSSSSATSSSSSASDVDPSSSSLTPSSSSMEISSSSGPSSSSVPQENTMEDAAGNIYKTVVIGTQTWMAENLAYTSSTSGKTWVYDQPNASNLGTYGLMFDWTAAKEACPANWRLPSDEDWTALDAYLGVPSYELGGISLYGSNQGDMLKKDTSLWQTNTGTNTTGFSALPGGYGDIINSNMTFIDIGISTRFWTSTAYTGIYPNPHAIVRIYYGSDSRIGRSSADQANAAYVRCIKN